MSTPKVVFDSVDHLPRYRSAVEASAIETEDPAASISEDGSL
jgi:hypothetical protein